MKANDYYFYWMVYGCCDGVGCVVCWLNHVSGQGLVSMKITIEVTNEEVQKALAKYEQCYDYTMSMHFYESEIGITLKQLIIIASLITTNVTIEEN